MSTNRLNRRQFLQRSAAATALTLGTGGLLPARAVVTAGKRTAVDQVTLGRTGLKLSRLGMGLGSNNGNVQKDLGQEAFNSLVKYAYDQGITYFDISQTYVTFPWLGAAIKGLPREKLFIQSKIPGQPADVLSVIDHHRKVFDTDYVDSILIHCMVREDWTDAWQKIMDGFNEAKSKGWIKSKGVSCHSVPALQKATATPWAEVHLVRVNPQGVHVDNAQTVVWSNKLGDVPTVVKEIKQMHEKGRGVIGMKICGNGEFTTPEDREKSIRYAMSMPEIDAVVIGLKSKAEVDEAIQRINNALAAV